MKAKAKTLADLASKPGTWPKPGACRICLTPETFTRGRDPKSSLTDGICTDRAACEKRAPTLELE